MLKIRNTILKYLLILLPSLSFGQGQGKVKDRVIISNPNETPIIEVDIGGGIVYRGKVALNFFTGNGEVTFETRFQYGTYEQIEAYGIIKDACSQWTKRMFDGDICTEGVIEPDTKVRILE